LSRPEIYEISKVLAALTIERESFTYIDKLSQASSKDVALYYIREALRDFYSLLNRGFEKAKDIASYISFTDLEKELNEIREAKSIAELREVVSLISAQALSEAAKIERKMQNEPTKSGGGQ